MMKILTHGERLAVQQQVQDDLELDDPGYISLIAVLARHYNSGTGQCNPSQETASKESRVGINRVPKMLRRLAERGHIGIIRTGRTNRYTLILKAVDKPAETATTNSSRVIRTNPRHGIVMPRRPLVKPCKGTFLENPPPRAAKAEEICLAGKRCGTEAPATPSEFTPEQRRIIARHEPLLTGNAAGRYTVARAIGEFPAPDGSDAWRWQIVKAVASGHLLA